MESAARNLNFPNAWLALILLVYVSLTYVRAAHKPFWYDEILTLAISGQGSVHEMWDAELMGFDLNPPLNCILTKLALSLPAKPEITARIPPLAGFLLMLVSLSAFVGRRLPPYFLLPALGFALLSGAYDYSFEARAFGVMAGCAGLALLSWQIAAEEGATRFNRVWALTALTLALSTALLSHCFAVLLYIPIGAAELVRTWKRKRIDRALWICIAISLAPVALYPALIAASKTIIEPPFFAAGPRRFLGAYSLLLSPAIIPVAIATAPLVLYAYLRRSMLIDRVSNLFRLVPLHERVAVVGFTLIPACGWAVAAILHSGYVPRYGIAGTLGFAVLFSFIVYVLADARPVWAQWIAGSAVVMFLIYFALDARHWRNQMPSGNGNQAMLTSLAASGRPVVISNGLAFLPLAYYIAPEGAGRITFLADPELAVRSTGTNLLDLALLRARPLLPIRGRIENYREFLKQNKRFWVFCPNPQLEEWICPQLKSEGASLGPGVRDGVYDVMVDER